MSKKIFKFEIVLILLFSLSLVTVASAQYSGSRKGVRTTDGNPRIRVEKNSLLVGETVRLGGTRFEAFEPVTIKVERTDMPSESGMFVGSWTVLADASGNVDIDWKVSTEGAFDITVQGTMKPFSRVETITAYTGSRSGKSGGDDRCDDSNSSGDGCCDSSRGGDRCCGDSHSGGKDDRCGCNEDDSYSANSSGGDDGCGCGDDDSDSSGGGSGCSATVIIANRAHPASSYQFDFVTTGLPNASFSLTDSDLNSDPMISMDSTTMGQKTVTLTNGNPYTLRSIDCSVSGNGGSTFSTLAKELTIDLKAGDVVTCVFVCDFVTAAEATVQGRVFDSYGRAIRGAVVTVQDQEGSIRRVTTNSMGRYSFTGLDSGNSYFFNAYYKGYSFGTRIVTLDKTSTSVDFNAAPR